MNACRWLMCTKPATGWREAHAAAIAGVALKGKKLLTRQDIGAWRRKKAFRSKTCAGFGNLDGVSSRFGRW